MAKLHRGRPRPAVVNECDGALARILYVAARVSGVIDQRGWFVLFVLQENRRRSRLVGNRLAAKLDDVIGDGRFFLGRGSSGGFGGVLRRVCEAFPVGRRPPVCRAWGNQTAPPRAG